MLCDYSSSAQHKKIWEKNRLRIRVRRESEVGRPIVVMPLKLGYCTETQYGEVSQKELRLINEALKLSMPCSPFFHIFFRCSLGDFADRACKTQRARRLTLIQFWNDINSLSLDVFTVTCNEMMKLAAHELKLFIRLSPSPVRVRCKFNVIYFATLIKKSPFTWPESFDFEDLYTFMFASLFSFSSLFFFSFGVAICESDAMNHKAKRKEEWSINFNWISMKARWSGGFTWRWRLSCCALI